MIETYHLVTQASPYAFPYAYLQNCSHGTLIHLYIIGIEFVSVYLSVRPKITLLSN